MDSAPARSYESAFQWHEFLFLFSIPNHCVSFASQFLRINSTPNRAIETHLNETVIHFRVHSSK